jgi:hypothetical protein
MTYINGTVTLHQPEVLEDAGCNGLGKGLHSHGSDKQGVNWDLFAGLESMLLLQ